MRTDTESRRFQVMRWLDSVGLNARDIAQDGALVTLRGEGFLTLEGRRAELFEDPKDSTRQVRRVCMSECDYCEGCDVGGHYISRPLRVELSDPPPFWSPMVRGQQLDLGNWIDEEELCDRAIEEATP